MTFEIVLVLATLAGAIACSRRSACRWTWRRFWSCPRSSAAGSSPEQAVSGFSNTATVTVAAMFVLSAGLVRTGVVGLLGKRLTRVGRLGLRPTLIALMALIGVVSACINNTAAVAIFLPIVLGLAGTRGSALRSC